MKLYQYQVFHNGEVVRTNYILAESEVEADHLMDKKYFCSQAITWQMTQELEAVDLTELMAL